MPQSASADASGAQAPHPQIAAYLDALKFERQLSPHTLESYTRELANQPKESFGIDLLKP